jgi:hypothetical protein
LTAPAHFPPFLHCIHVTRSSPILAASPRPGSSPNCVCAQLWELQDPATSSNRLSSSPCPSSALYPHPLSSSSILLILLVLLVLLNFGSSALPPPSPRPLLPLYQGHPAVHPHHHLSRRNRQCNHSHHHSHHSQSVTHSSTMSTPPPRNPPHPFHPHPLHPRILLILIHISRHCARVIQ